MLLVYRSRQIRSHIFLLLFGGGIGLLIFLCWARSAYATEPEQGSAATDEKLTRVVRLLAAEDSESLNEATKIILSKPKESWAIVEEIAAKLERKHDSRVLHAMRWLIAQVDSSELIKKWGDSNLLDRAILAEIGDRLKLDTGSETFEIDLKTALKMFREGLANNETRLATLRVLEGCPEVTFDEKLVDSIIGCLDDESLEEHRSCGGTTVYTVRGRATAVLSQHVANHERRLVPLLFDRRDDQRRCGIEIVVGDPEVLARHADRILELSEDPDPEVRDAAIRKLPHLKGRTKEVVEAIINLKVDSDQRVYALRDTFPSCDKRDQSRIANWIVDRVVEEEFGARHVYGNVSTLKGILPELDQPTLDKVLQRLLVKFERSNFYQETDLNLLSVAGPRAAIVKPALRGMLKTAPAVMKPVVAATLYRVAKEADEVLPYYQAALESEDEKACSAALRGVKELGAKAAPLVPVILARLDEPSKGRYRCIIALRAIGPPAAAAIPKLEQLLEESEEKSNKKRIESALRVIRNGPV